LPRSIAIVKQRTIIGVILASWFLAVNIVILTGIWQSDPYSVGVNVVGSVLLLVLLGSKQPLKQAVDRLDNQTLIYIHALRIWGLLLLPFSGAGVVAIWAVPVAAAEITLGVLALPLGYFAGVLQSRVHLALLWTWSVVGLLSAIAAPATAIWHSTLDNSSMQALSNYPLALVPSFFMPLAITAHVFFIRRLLQWNESWGEANDLLG
jgi:uncharacterized membrane protein YiaA